MYNWGEQSEAPLFWVVRNRKTWYVTEIMYGTSWKSWYIAEVVVRRGSRGTLGPLHIYMVDSLDRLVQHISLLIYSCFSFLEGSAHVCLIMFL